MQSLSAPADVFDNIRQLVLETDTVTIPESTLHTAKLLILDLIGVMVAGSQLNAGNIVRDYAVLHWAAGPGAPVARLPLDGRSVSLPGYAFAMASQIDNLDAHDGWQPSKGHAGAALFPALLAFAEAQESVSGPQALTSMVLGYEIAYRAAAALHATVDDYHTSGAWNALGCVAIGAYLRQLSAEQFRHALGIAEYHGPRSQMMREIANPTMLHDGSGWGAPGGIHAVLIAELGFTGAPAATVEFNDAKPAWSDLGKLWITEHQYIKPYPVCRWAHAAIDATLALRTEHAIHANDIASIEISTFAYAADLYAGIPDSTTIAQYSLAWPVAAAMVRGCVTVDEVIDSSFSDPDIAQVLTRISVVVLAEYENAYPEQRLASVSITLLDGTRHDSGLTVASGGPCPQAGDVEVIEKYRRFAGPVLGEPRMAQIEEAVMKLNQPRANFKSLIDLLVATA